MNTMRETIYCFNCGGRATHQVEHDNEQPTLMCTICASAFRKGQRYPYESIYNTNEVVPIPVDKE